MRNFHWIYKPIQLIALQICIKTTHREHFPFSIMKSFVHCTILILIAVLSAVGVELSKGSTITENENHCDLTTCATGKMVCGCNESRCKYFGGNCIDLYNACYDEGELDRVSLITILIVCLSRFRSCWNGAMRRRSPPTIRVKASVSNELSKFKRFENEISVSHSPLHA